MRIAITGKICSGKSFIANHIAKQIDANIYSFGTGVKKYCKEIFNMEYKDRKLLQDFAQKMKEIDNDVWIKYTMNEINNDKKSNILLDDLRFHNEANYLISEGFTIIRLVIGDNLQKQRIIQTYPNTYTEHLNRLNDISESHIHFLPFDYSINISENNDNYVIHRVDEIIKNLQNKNNINVLNTR